MANTETTTVLNLSGVSWETKPLIQNLGISLKKITLNVRSCWHQGEKITLDFKPSFYQFENSLDMKSFWFQFNPFPNKPWFSHVCSTSLLKTLLEMEKLLLKSNFSIPKGVYYPFGKLSAIFIEFETVICKLL